MINLVVSSAALFLTKTLLLGQRILALLAVAKMGDAPQLAAASYAIALAEMSRLLADWGTDTWAIRAIAMAKDADERKRLLSTALCIKAAGGVLCSAGIMIVCVLHFPTDGVALGGLAALLLLSSQIAGMSITYFQAVNRLRELIVVALPCLLTTALIVACAFAGQATAGLIVLAAGEVFTAMLLLRQLKREQALNFGAVSSASLRAVATQSFPAAIFGLIVGLYSRLDTLVLAQVSAAALATYTVAYRLFLPFQVAVTTLGSIIYSSTSLALGAGNRTAATFYLRELPATVALSAVAAVALWSVGHILIETYFPVFGSAGAVLDVLCILLVLLGASAAMAARVLAHGHVRAIAIVAAIDLVAVITAMIFLVPRDAASGCALALVIGACINLGVTLIYAYFTIERTAMPVFAK